MQKRVGQQLGVVEDGAGIPEKKIMKTHYKANYMQQDIDRMMGS